MRADLLTFDIDGTLTDGTTWWGGPEHGWLQRFSVRDGEALLRLCRRMFVVPLSRNKTESARVRMTALGFDTRWVGTADKLAAIEQISSEFGVTPARICHVGDGPDDGDVFAHVGFGCAVADAHPMARQAATHVLQANGGARVIEELELALEC